MADNALILYPIARVHSPFKEKFGIPRQPGLVPSAEGVVEMLPGYADPAMVEGLDGFSHLWLTFHFHACAAQGWRARVRPPRLGGNREVGVLASRAPFRPNFLGLSAVRLLRVDIDHGVSLHVAGLDLLDGTPILDIKPYVPYTDALPNAQGGFASAVPDAVNRVEFTPAALAFLQCNDPQQRLQRLISETLALDPRPGYRRATSEPGRRYGMRLAGLEVRWVTDDGVSRVLEISAAD